MQNWSGTKGVRKYWTWSTCHLERSVIWFFFFFCLSVFQVRNEPKNIYIAAEYIAKIKGIPVEEVIEVTTQNALKVFRKLRNFVRV